MEQPAASRATNAPGQGSRDGSGAGDHDLPFQFGFRPSSGWTYPFTERQFARLLVLRGRIQDGELVDDRAKA